MLMPTNNAAMKGMFIIFDYVVMDISFVNYYFALLTYEFYFLSIFSVVEFASLSDMKTAIEKLDDTELNGRRVRLVEDRRGGRSGGTFIFNSNINIMLKCFYNFFFLVITYIVSIRRWSW